MARRKSKKKPVLRKKSTKRPVRPRSRVQDALLAEFRTMDLGRDRPSRRDLTSLNVERMPKEGFERIADIYSARVGRTLTHWEAFAFMVAETSERYEEELVTMRGRSR